MEVNFCGTATGVLCEIVVYTYIIVGNLLLFMRTFGNKIYIEIHLKTKDTEHTLPESLDEILITRNENTKQHFLKEPREQEHKE